MTSREQREGVQLGGAQEWWGAGSPMGSCRLRAQAGRQPSAPAEFRFQRLEGNGTPDAARNLMFNPLSVYLLSCQECP